MRQKLECRAALPTLLRSREELDARALLRSNEEQEQATKVSPPDYAISEASTNNEAS